MFALELAAIEIMNSSCSREKPKLKRELLIVILFLAGERKTMERIGNYFQINEKLNLPRQYRGPLTDTTDR